MRKRFAALKAATVKRAKKVGAALHDNADRLLTTALDLLGFVLVSGGAFLIYHPAGVIAAGAFTLYVSGSLAGAPPIKLPGRRPAEDDSE
jgi:uncharacterized ion transporter superfamily protein YfcC